MTIYNNCDIMLNGIVSKKKRKDSLWKKKDGFP